MNVLLVGLGRWGEKHLRVLAQLGATVWVADVSAARRQWAVGQGVDPARAVADLCAALLQVAAVDIVTPADGHRAVAQACLRLGVTASSRSRWLSPSPTAGRWGPPPLPPGAPCRSDTFSDGSCFEDPSADEIKFFAPGVGNIKVQSLDGTEEQHLAARGERGRCLVEL
jgi:hypothetical protein